MTSVLKPSVVWIEGRCYRSDDSVVAEKSTFQEHDLYDNDVPYNNEVPDCEEDNDIEVVTIDNTRYKANFHVSRHYFGAIIGKKGAIRMRLERDTRTEIKIPRQGQTGDIMIFGSNVSNVKTAWKRINRIVISSRLKQKPTHFISLPMNSQTIVENLIKFKDAVLRDCSKSRGLVDGLFISPHKVHLTVGVMCLMDNEERSQASQLLTEAKDTVVMPLLQGHLPLRVRLKGLNYMNDDPREINVLYGTVEEEGGNGFLQKLADDLVKHFSTKGFMKDDEYGNHHVKLHMTLLNTRYRQKQLEAEANNEETPKKNERITFDGTEILEKFSNYDFGVTEITEIHLSQMSVGPEVTLQYYKATCVISLK